ncbi:MAG: HAD family hydrolase, partial [Chloroflexia bacterium]|nr:HAD family hydrolase [Chloroflexia bacterium]
PADHYVLVEDKPELLTSVRGRLGSRLTTVLIRQGRYAAMVPTGGWDGADITLDQIGDLCALNLADFWLR